MNKIMNSVSISNLIWFWGRQALTDNSWEDSHKTERDGEPSETMPPFPTGWKSLNTEQSYKRQGHTTFEAFCYLFCAMAESWTTVA